MVYIQYPYGERQSEAIPTGLQCSNYKTEEAILHVAHTITNDVISTSTVVFFFTNALFVLQSLTNNKLPLL